MAGVDRRFALLKHRHDDLIPFLSVKDPRFGAAGENGIDDANAFDEAARLLPDDGGVVFVPQGDYSSTTGSKVDVGDKVVTWLSYGATMPDDLPGAVITTGRKSLTASIRDSEFNARVFSHLDLNDWEVSVGNKDRVYYVEGNLPNDEDATTQRELIAYSFKLTTDHETLEGGDIRGIKGICIGNGGKANIRAAHVLAQGTNGFTGNLTGLLAVADHEDATDGAAGSVGDSVAIRGTVGAGCQAVYEAASYGGVKQRPSFGYRIKGGAQALLPETACFQGHGGGNGALFRGIKSDTDTTCIYEVDKVGRTMGRAFISGRRTVNDDSVLTLNTPQATGQYGIIKLMVANTSQGWAEVYYRHSGTVLCEKIVGGTIWEFTTSTDVGGSLAGTTGTDEKITVSVTADGTIEIENRLGGSREVSWMFIATASENGEVAA
jgi:hypothetical protein